MYVVCENYHSNYPIQIYFKTDHCVLWQRFAYTADGEILLWKSVSSVSKDRQCVKILKNLRVLDFDLV